MLKVLDYIAAPFGSQEYMHTHFGMPDADFTYDEKGNPILNKQGVADLGATSPSSANIFANITAPAPILFSAADPAYPARVQGYEKILAPMSVEDASLGLFSTTQASKGTPVLQKFGDGMTDIIAGRRPMSDFDQILKDWKVRRRRHYPVRIRKGLRRFEGVTAALRLKIIGAPPARREGPQLRFLCRG